MKIKHLTIKIYRTYDDEIAYFSFYRDNNKNPFATLDGGWCTHEQFIMACDLVKERKWLALRAAVAIELDRDPKSFDIINIYPDGRRVILCSSDPVFTLEELL